MSEKSDQFAPSDIAIIGIGLHVPGARSVAAFWENLRAGQCSIRRMSNEELLAAGEAPALVRNPDYVPFAAPLHGFAEFDPDIFGLSPKEAAIMDPQHRVFLEIAWHALEDAGYAPNGHAGRTGVFAGCGMTGYFYHNILSNPALVSDVGLFLLRHTGNDKDFLSTRISHALDLKGPSLNVQTACSTSLVAVHQAIQSILVGECDMALAGGVTIEVPHGLGYVFKENEYRSPDGLCHAFDHRGEGTIFGSGAGVVVLRRAADAWAAGDRILAIIKGSAINNDGAAKAGYLAPSIDGQAKAITEALRIAKAPADSISYVECHGTGTRLGDPIEIAALTQAFRTSTDATGFCRVGSVKTNIGHLDTAAGIVGLIKTVLALGHRELPPTLGYERPNPAIDFEASPFVVNDRLTQWQGPRPLRAGVTSLGVGGTNAHVVLQEAPDPLPSEPSDWPFQILTLSAKCQPALDEASRALAAHLRAHPDQSLADIAFTLKEGRSAFEHRRVLVAASHSEAADLLEGDTDRRVYSHIALDAPDIVFMFPGGGAQYAGMARDLYATEPVFADWMDRGLAILQRRLDFDLRALWLPPEGAETAADAALTRPSVQLPLIMITEYALARLFESWGVIPSVLVGHSMGENTAACLAGVMTFEECIGLVSLRGRLFDTVAPGGMLSVPLSPEALAPYLGPEHDIASRNAADLTVISGPQAALDRLEAALVADDIAPQRIAIDIAAHSKMLGPILPEYRDFLEGITLNPPRLPVISNRTGKPLTDAQATDPGYWVDQLRHTVEFGSCIETLSARPNRIYLEMGPGKALAALARMHPKVSVQQVVSVLRHRDQTIADDMYHLCVLGRIWALGGRFDWTQIWGEARRCRVRLPGYAFQRSHFFIEPGKSAASEPSLLTRLETIDDWGSRITWKPAYADCDIDVATDLSMLHETWLIFADEAGVAAPVVNRLRAAGQQVITLRAGDTFARKSETDYTIAPELGREEYARLLEDLDTRAITPTRIAHFWLVTARETFRPGSNFAQRNIEQGFYALVFLLQALQDRTANTPVHLSIITSGAQAAPGETLKHPEKALLAGPARVAPREMPWLTCASLDIEPPQRADPALTTALLEELCARPTNGTAVLRGARRQIEVLRPAPLLDTHAQLEEGTHWIITGGFGGIGLTLAEALIRHSKARITLLARTPLPDRAAWNDGEQSADVIARMRAVQRLEALGGSVHVATADVSNLEEMRAAVAGAQAEFGTPYGLIHAAGLLHDAPLATKTQGQIDNVLAPKLHGLRVIDSVLPDGTLDVLVLLSSTSTLTGPAGQVDYVASNAYLNAFAEARKTGRTRVLALNWGIWADVGMAADALATGLGETRRPPALPCDQPLFDEIGETPQGNPRLTTRISSSAWVFDEHRTKDGAAILPGTAYLDLAVEAARATGLRGPLDLRDVSFLRPLHIDEGETRLIRADLIPTEQGHAFTVQSELSTPGVEGFVLHAQAQLARTEGVMPPALDLAAIGARCPEKTEGTVPLSGPQDAHMRFGPRWQVLRMTALGAGEGLAHLALPPAFHGDLEAGHVLHPALMDMATSWAMALIPGYTGAHLWVPALYEKVTVWRDFPTQLVSHARLAATDDPDLARFNLTLANEAGEVVAEVEGFTLKRLDQGDLATPPRLRGAPIAREAKRAPSTLSPAEERLREALVLGIKRHEGGAAFLRALAQPHSRLIVSSIPIEALIARTALELQPDAFDARFSRPELGRAFVAPRNAIEEALAEIWCQALGLDKVGIDDDFFELGGHSMVAARVFSRVKKQFALEFPMSILFEAPTIAACAALVAERTGPLPHAPEKPATLRRKTRFTHVVPMNDGARSGALPFFMVAGMFGNVLNLRHLATLLGRDRPFYGLQARGLLGDAAPHATIEAAATDHLAEIRQVQPHGPYLIGGFSGGGITAFEIAHQLRAMGEEVGIVVLLDTPIPVRPKLSLPDKALIKLAQFRRKGPAYAAEWWRARRDWTRQLAEGPPPDSPDAFHNAAVQAAYLEATARYSLRPFEGNVVLFRPPLDLHWKVTRGNYVSTAREYVFDDNQWGRFAPDLRVLEVPGDHDSMVLEPNVRVLAERMRSLLFDAAARPEAAE